MPDETTQPPSPPPTPPTPPTPVPPAAPPAPRVATATDEQQTLLAGGLPPSAVFDPDADAKMQVEELLKVFHPLLKRWVAEGKVNSVAMIVNVDNNYSWWHAWIPEDTGKETPEQQARMRSRRYTAFTNMIYQGRHLLAQMIQAVNFALDRVTRLPDDPTNPN